MNCGGEIASPCPARDWMSAASKAKGVDLSAGSSVALGFRFGSCVTKSLICDLLDCGKTGHLFCPRMCCAQAWGASQETLAKAYTASGLYLSRI